MDFRNDTFVIEEGSSFKISFRGTVAGDWRNVAFVNTGVEIARVVVPEKQRGEVELKFLSLGFTVGRKGRKFRGEPENGGRGYRGLRAEGLKPSDSKCGLGTELTSLVSLLERQAPLSHYKPTESECEF